MALACFDVGPQSWPIESWDVGFCGEGKTEQGENNNKLNPHIALGRNQTLAAMVRGARSHYYAIPAPGKS